MTLALWEYPARTYSFGLNEIHQDENHFKTEPYDIYDLIFSVQQHFKLLTSLNDTYVIFPTQAELSEVSGRSERRDQQGLRSQSNRIDISRGHLVMWHEQKPRLHLLVEDER